MTMRLTWWDERRFVPNQITAPCGYLERRMKAFYALIVGMFVAAGLSACNTVEGVGQDVKAAGSKVEGEAKEHKKY
jgi:predicted small secreted protein